MNKKVLMGLVLLVIIGTSAIFAQAPTLDKLFFGAITNANAYDARPANNQISGAVVIPDTYNGKPVTKVLNFGRNTGITSVIFPNSLTLIETNAFVNCTGLTSSVTIPASVATINPGAFVGCTNLTSVTFQGSKIILATGSQRSFDGDLDAKFRAGSAGTYTRSAGGTVWTKQGGVALCPYCGQPLPAGFKAP